MNIRKEQIGNCTLYCGDCLEIMSEISGVDAVITDPPYGCTMNTWDEAIDLDAFWRAILPTTTHNAAFCLFSQMPFTVDLIASNREMFRYDIVWRKQRATGFLNAKKMPLRAHELIVVFYRALPTYNPQKFYRDTLSYRSPDKTRSSKNYGKFSRDNPTGSTDGSRYPLDVVYIDYESEFFKKASYQMHPTQKPVGIMDWLIKTYSNGGEIVFDPFMGAGTTGVACVASGRKFVGVEKDERYFETACKRIEAAIKNALAPTQIELLDVVG